MTERISRSFFRFTAAILPANPIICDIGSRDALEGIALFRGVAAKHLHVFEANPAAAVRCRQNLTALDPQAFTFNQVAVSDQHGQVKFYSVDTEASENKDIGFSSLLLINPDYTRRRGMIVQNEIVVTAITLDDYFSTKQKPDLLWIDVEGAELRVLQGGEQALVNVKVVHIEVSFRPMQIGKPLFEEIRRCLKQRNFEFHGFSDVSTLKGFLYRHHLLPNRPWRLNAVFYKK